MPNWGYLPEEEIAAVAGVVRRFGVDALIEELIRDIADARLTQAEAEEILIAQSVPGAKIEVPFEPENSEEGSARGRAIYLEACASCHGPDGKAKWGALKTDFEGNVLRPTTLAGGEFKGGKEGEQIYFRIVKGMSGTAMPGFEDAYEAGELWDLVHYVMELAE
jgi:mono/diheme cytochrome c family protein